MTFTISCTVFFSFLLPTLAASSQTQRIVYGAFTLIGLVASVVSYFAWDSEKYRFSVSKGEVTQVVQDIESLYPEGSVGGELTTSADSADDDKQRIEPLNDDELLKVAIELAQKEGKISTSMLQRHLRIGYGRAARVMDVMEAKGIVGEMDGARPRNILVGKSESNKEGDAGRSVS